MREKLLPMPQSDSLHEEGVEDNGEGRKEHPRSKRAQKQNGTAITIFGTRRAKEIKDGRTKNKINNVSDAPYAV